MAVAMAVAMAEAMDTAVAVAMPVALAMATVMAMSMVTAMPMMQYNESKRQLPMQGYASCIYSYAPCSS